MDDKNKQNIELLAEYFKESGAIDNEILEMYGQIAKNIHSTTRGVASVLSEAVSPIIESMKTIDKIVEPFTRYMKEVSQSITPILQYLDDNKEKISNFSNSLEGLIEHYSEVKNVSTDDAAIIVEELFDDGKAIINEDWSIEIVDDQVENSLKSQYSFSDILNLINILLAIILPAQTMNIDNSTTNNEYHTHHHYHIEQHETVNNEQVVIKRDTNIHAEPDEGSEILTTLDIGDIVYNVITEDGWTLILLLNEGNEFKYDGWVRNDYINPIVD